MGLPLKKEFDYYVDNYDQLAKKYDGKYIVIKEEELIGVYNTSADAIRETTKTHKLGTFFMKKCEAGSKNYRTSFHSRVVFS